MEHMEAFHDGEWEFLSRMFSQEQELDHSMLSEFLDQCPIPSENDHGMLLNSAGESSLNTTLEANRGVTAGANPSMISCIDNLSSHFLSAPHSYGGVFSINSSTQGSLLSSFNPAQISDTGSMSSDSCMGIAHEKHVTASNCAIPLLPDVAGDKIASVGEAMNNGKFLAPIREMPLKKFKLPELHAGTRNSVSSLNSKKRLCVPRHAEDSCKRNMRSKKTQKLTRNGSSEDIYNGGGSDGQSSSSCGSDEENAYQEIYNGGGPASKPQDSPSGNSNAKMRASRGTATDPQSLYARKRRERINERLKILQGLVPNGTKVDISTMLEEAVHYVKFLQLQIKLLSSDDLWMYAPIAYNGLDMGLHQKLFSQLLPQ